MKTRRADKQELNEVLREMIPKGFYVPELDMELPIPEKMEAEKQVLGPRKFSLERIFVEIQRMKRGKEFKITID